MSIETRLGTLLTRMAAGCDRLQDPLLLLLRLYFGLTLAVIGAGKLADLSGTAGYFASLEIPLPGLNAFLAGLAECLGGALLAAGAAARLAAIPLSVTMLVAYFTAHGGERFLAAKPFPFLFACLVVLAFGPGRWSVDHRLRSAAQPADASS